MKKFMVMIAVGLAVVLAGAWQAQAEDLSKQDPVELAVHLGDKRAASSSSNPAP